MILTLSCFLGILPISVSFSSFPLIFVVILLGTLPSVLFFKKISCFYELYGTASSPKVKEMVLCKVIPCIDW